MLDQRAPAFQCRFVGSKAGSLGHIIVLELLHFSVPNHGKLWKSLMRAHLGDYESMERKLKKFAIHPS